MYNRSLSTTPVCRRSPTRPWVQNSRTQEPADRTRAPKTPTCCTPRCQNQRGVQRGRVQQSLSVATAAGSAQAEPCVEHPVQPHSGTGVQPPWGRAFLLLTSLARREVTRRGNRGTTTTRRWLCTCTGVAALPAAAPVHPWPLGGTRSSEDQVGTRPALRRPGSSARRRCCQLWLYRWSDPR